MNLVQKVFWPSVLALGLVLFLATVKSPVDRVEAVQPGDSAICRINGPTLIDVGQTALYTFRVQDNAEDVFERVGVQDRYSVDLDNADGGHSEITGAVIQQSGDEWISFNDLNHSGFVNSIQVESPDHIDPDLLAYLEDEYDFHLDGNPCGARVSDVLQECLAGGAELNINGRISNGCRAPTNEDVDEGLIFATPEQRQAWADAIENAMADGVVNCDDLASIGDRALVQAGFSERYGRQQIEQYWLLISCDFYTSANIGPVLDDLGFVEVTCEKSGPFDLSFSDREASEIPGLGSFPDGLSIDVYCRGNVGNANMKVFPSPVEIIPAFNSTSHALVTVDLLDEDGNALPFPGTDVTFKTDNCAIESSGVDDEMELLGAEAVFGAYSPFVANSGENIENSPAAQVAPDAGSPRLEEVKSFYVLGTRVVAATILHCGVEDTEEAAAGVANVTALIEKPGDDFALTVSVQVVGPPYAINLSGAPASVICGEKVEVTAEVFDVLGQPVSDHTVVEVVTNYGGVLAGTGAVAGQAAPTAPISSTVAETFGGKAVFYLLTSDTHEGAYQVLLTTGGGAYVANGQLGGTYLTPPVSIQITVECNQPAEEEPPAVVPGSPTVTSPSAGGPGGSAGGSSITPPSTGDAGLEAFHQQAWPYLVAGIVGFLLAGLASLKFARD